MLPRATVNDYKRFYLMEYYHSDVVKYIRKSRKDEGVYEELHPGDDPYLKNLVRWDT